MDVLLRSWSRMVLVFTRKEVGKKARERTEAWSDFVLEQLHLTSFG